MTSGGRCHSEMVKLGHEVESLHGNCLTDMQKKNCGRRKGILLDCKEVIRVEKNGQDVFFIGLEGFCVCCIYQRGIFIIEFLKAKHEDSLFSFQEICCSRWSWEA